MRFSGSEAWQEAQAIVSRNREIFLVMAGVFFLLPSLLVALVYPQPEPQAGMTPEQTLALVADFWKGAFPAYFVMGLFQTIGTLALLRLSTDLTRPTVADAIKVGVAGLLTYLGAQILVGLGLGLAGGLLIAAAGVTGSKALVAVAVIALVVAAVYLMLRTALISAVIAIEAERNPVTGLRRSWDLTRGNTGALFVFFLLLALAFAVILVVTMMVVGVALALFTGSETAKTLAALVSAALTAGMSLYFIAALASAHRQLAGRSEDPALGTTFE